VFDSLNTMQWQVVLLAMEKRHCSAGEVVVQQVRLSTSTALLFPHQLPYQHSAFEQACHESSKAQIKTAVRSFTCSPWPFVVMPPQ
jgi:hypothetical protein